jgi:uncharacterized protein (TIGR02598 family)
MNNRPQSTAAFSLVEVTLALGVAAFCLIAILGLLPAGVNTNQASVRQTTANGILSAIVADLRATSATTSQSKQFAITFGQTKKLYFAGDGTYSTTAPSTKTIFLATVKFSGDGEEEEDEGGSGHLANVKVTWPYSAAAAGGSSGGDDDDHEEGSGSTQSAPAPAGIVETFVGLDRNSGSDGGGDD